MDMFLKYQWPGNVRELENAVERAVILLRGDHVTEKELPLSITEPYQQEDGPVSTPAPSIGNRSLEDVEREAILEALDEAGGNKSKAARKLGITRKTLHSKLKKYGK